MAILKEIWATDIAEKLFPSNSFIGQSVDDSMWVSGKKVHRANAGDLPGVQKDRTVFPAPVTPRTDEDADYNIHEHTSDPTRIRDIEEIETNYQKRQSVLSGHIKVINNSIANWMAHDWAPTAEANFIRTSGADRPANLDGATGTRKKLTVEDILKAKAILDDMDLPMDGRNILIPSHMYNDMLLSEYKYLESLDKQGKAVLKDGNIAALFGLKIFIRGKKNVLSYTNAATPALRTPVATTGKATANAAALLWHKDFVARAKGDVKVYHNEDDATIYGSVFSAMARAGGQKTYLDGTGVMAIIEAAGA